MIRMLSSDLKKNLRVVKEKDPSVKSSLEAFVANPGILAIFLYRIAHQLYLKKKRISSRLLSQLGRTLTGIEIHPGASIGQRLFIDHGMGTVIGETAVIGDDVTLFHNVTLGGIKNTPFKRHPTIGDRVLVSAGAKVLGNIYIANDVKIGANAVVLQDLPEGVTAVGVPASIVLRNAS